MKMVCARGCKNTTMIENTIGEEFTNVIVGSGYTDVNTTYYLGGEYERLSFDVSCPETSPIDEKEFEFVVYANNDEANVLYKGIMGRKIARQNVVVDLSDVDFLTFKAKGEGLSDGIGYIISDSRLQ